MSSHTQTAKNKAIVKNEEAWTFLEGLIEIGYDIEIQKVQPWHLRIKGAKGLLDIFPKTRKYHNITLDKWGIYNEDSIYTLIKSLLK